MRFRDRVLFVALAILDRVFGTHWMQRELRRRQNRLAEHQARMANIEQQIDQLQDQLVELHVQLCVLYLRGRYMADLEDWLRFEPGSGDEPGLDILIEHLVKPRLAAIEIHETAPDCRVYHLCPDWRAIAAAIGDTGKLLEPETLAWLRQRVAEQSQSIAS